MKKAYVFFNVANYICYFYTMIMLMVIPRKEIKTPIHTKQT